MNPQSGREPLESSFSLRRSDFSVGNSRQPSLLTPPGDYRELCTLMASLALGFSSAISGNVCCLGRNSSECFRIFAKSRSDHGTRVDTLAGLALAFNLSLNRLSCVDLLRQEPLQSLSNVILYVE